MGGQFGIKFYYINGHSHFSECVFLISHKNINTLKNAMHTFYRFHAILFFSGGGGRGWLHEKHYGFWTIKLRYF